MRLNRQRCEIAVCFASYIDSQPALLNLQTSALSAGINAEKTRMSETKDEERKAELKLNSGDNNREPVEEKIKRR